MSKINERYLHIWDCPNYGTIAISLSHDTPNAPIYKCENLNLSYSEASEVVEKLTEILESHKQKKGEKCT